jgi:hypothetical protein
MQTQIYEKILQVPYHSQFLEVHDDFWNIRSCGGACVKMICDYHGSQSENIQEIMEYAKDNGGYGMTNGFIHDFAVHYFKNRDMFSHRVDMGFTSIDEEEKKKNNFNYIIDSINQNNPVITSIAKQTLEQKKGHLIVVVGYKYILADTEFRDQDDNRIISHIVYHEPESTDENRGQYRECEAKVFFEAFTGKAIFASRNNLNMAF